MLCALTHDDISKRKNVNHDRNGLHPEELDVIIYVHDKKASAQFEWHV